MAKNSKFSNDNIWFLDGNVAKGYPSASLDSEENRDLALLVGESSARLDRELAELEDVVAQMSMLIEAARETSSLNRSRISTLQAVANSHGTDLRTLLQQSRSVLARARAGDRSPPEQEPPAVEAAEQQAEPELFGLGQG